jgi:hypothetical protein
LPTPNPYGKQDSQRDFWGGTFIVEDDRHVYFGSENPDVPPGPGTMASFVYRASKCDGS